MAAVLHCRSLYQEALAEGHDCDVPAGFIASAPDFRKQGRVLDAASEVLIGVFGERGHHVRSAIGVASLSANAMAGTRIDDPMQELTMRVHELNCGTLNPRGGAAQWGLTHFVCRCLLIELDALLIAVDTGIGLADIADPEHRLGTDWIGLTNPKLDPAEALVNQIASLGFKPTDLTDVVLTHHHRDHVGGLADVPWARIHAMAESRAAVDAGDRVLAAQWQHDLRWAPAPSRGPDWHGLATYQPVGLPRGVRFVDLPGHAPGHAGVLLEGGGAGGANLLHVGDALFHHAQLEREEPAAVRAFVAATQNDPIARTTTENVLRALSGVQLTTSHDPSL